METMTQAVPLVSVPLVCTDCGATLHAEGQAALMCPECSRRWDVVRGIPRMFEGPDYWGEIGRNEAQELIHDAEIRGWRQAVQRGFHQDREVQGYVLDWQRAAWIPMLGLHAGATVLDIGSGYGAITHALAQSFDRVCSVEAIPERIDFTRVRLAQEQISNVQLVQGSALELPFPDSSFDLVVVNGVLEWVGDWDSRGDPREVQIRFLQKISRLLKPEGVLLVGIENRFGHRFMRGAVDHSGMRYTSLMPRFLASLCMRWNQGAHYRTGAVRQRQYRTYTYSRKGYEKLFGESGFGRTSFYWADPGYNLPHRLVPLDAGMIRACSRHQQKDQSPAQYHRLRSRLKCALAPALSYVAPDFVILAKKGETRAEAAEDPVIAALGRHFPDSINPWEAACWSATHPFGKKLVARVADRATGTAQLMLKFSTPAPGGRSHVAEEFRASSLVAAKLRAQANPRFSIPEPLRSFEVGRSCAAIEQVADGEQLSALLLDADQSKRAALARTHFRACVEVAIEAHALLARETTLRRLDESWWQTPPELSANNELSRALAEARRWGPDAPESTVQHGDFTINNVFVEPSTRHYTVIDWGHLTAGAPPLYDVFTFLVSVLPFIGVQGRSQEGDPLLQQFREAFFGYGRWSELFRWLLADAAAAFSVPQDEVWKLFLVFLVVRRNYHLNRGSRQADKHLQFLTIALAQQSNFLVNR